MIASNKFRRGFSLVELLVAIGVIGLLLAILLPAIQQSRQAAIRLTCRNQLHQIGIAMHNYLSTHSAFPPGGVHMTTKPPGTIPIGDPTTDGRALWTVLILPQLDEGNLYNSFNCEAAFLFWSELRSLTPEPNQTLQFTRVLKFACPSDPNSQFQGLVSNYAACQGGGLPADAAEQTGGSFPRLFFDNGMFFHNSHITPADVADGMSNTVMVGETKYVGYPTTFVPTDAWWPWSAAIRSSDNPTNPTPVSLFNISATVDPINFPQNGQYTEQDIVAHRGVYQGCGHGGQQRVFGSWHRGGAHFLMADGSVIFLNENMNPDEYRTLGQRSDRQPVEF